MTSTKLLISLALFLCLAQISQAEWLNGLNMPVRIWGEDFGKSYDQGWFRAAFQKYHNSGANTVRIWIYFNTAPQSSVLYDGNGYFNSPTQQFLNDISDCLRLANESGLRVIFSLFSFECVEQEKCRNMIADENKQTPFINNALGPILDHFNNQGLSQIVYAIELFNEPEHMIHTDLDGTVLTGEKLQLGQVQNFITKCNKVITDKGFKATIGSISLMFSCNCGYGCKGNYWGNTGLSFYSIHFYGWMAANGSRYDPFSTRPSDWCLEKPALVEEAADFTENCLQGTLEVKHQYYLAQRNGWIGNMPWADNGGAEWSQYNNIHSGLVCNWDMNSCKPYYINEEIKE